MGEAIKVIVNQPNDKYGKPTKMVPGEELADIPISYAEWKRHLWKWGN